MPPQPSSFSYCYQSNHQQIGEQRQLAYHEQSAVWWQPSRQNQPRRDNEAALLETPVKCQQRDMPGSCGAHPQEKGFSAGTLTPMRAEISKLLEALFDRNIDRSS
jgi:hypothetical protein